MLSSGNNRGLVNKGNGGKCSQKYENKRLTRKGGQGTPTKNSVCNSERPEILCEEVSVQQKREKTFMKRKSLEQSAYHRG